MSFPGADVKVSSWQQMMVELHSRRSCVFRGMDNSELAPRNKSEATPRGLDQEY